MICEKLGTPAQMDSKFKISCAFMGPNPDDEEEMNKAVQSYLLQHGAMNQQNKRQSKQYGKRKEKEKEREKE